MYVVFGVIVVDDYFVFDDVWSICDCVWFVWIDGFGDLDFFVGFSIDGS